MTDDPLETLITQVADEIIRSITTYDLSESERNDLRLKYISYFCNQLFKRT